MHITAPVSYRVLLVLFGPEGGARYANARVSRRTASKGYLLSLNMQERRKPERCEFRIGHGVVVYRSTKDVSKFVGSTGSA